MNWKLYASPEQVVQALSEDLLVLSKTTSIKHISLSGGSTPKLWFTTLGKPPWAQTIRWENLHFWWGDERCVAPDDPESNFGAVNELLFRHIDIPRQNLHRIHGENSPEQEAQRYAKEIDSFVAKNDQGVPVFDWIHLGIGDDGHTASLFPNQVDYTDSHTVITAKHPESGQNRVTKTANLLMAGKRLSYLVLGKKKAALLHEIEELEKKEETSTTLPWPAAAIRSAQGITEWYLDLEAASLLSDTKKKLSQENL